MRPHGSSMNSKDCFERLSVCKCRENIRAMILFQDKKDTIPPRFQHGYAMVLQNTSFESTSFFSQMICACESRPSSSYLLGSDSKFWGSAEGNQSMKVSVRLRQGQTSTHTGLISSELPLPPTQGNHLRPK